ncbi:hypothetical protein JKG47_03940 [Acidithiobacillus sp. MC6.1]|nr:hypothetical protein [Acidithiobacillus sp. MC6.1]
MALHIDTFLARMVLLPAPILIPASLLTTLSLPLQTFSADYPFLKAARTAPPR